jgi:outer membrane protein TolC
VGDGTRKLGLVTACAVTLLSTGAAAQTAPPHPMAAPPPGGTGPATAAPAPAPAQPSPAPTASAQAATPQPATTAPQPSARPTLSLGDALRSAVGKHPSIAIARSNVGLAAAELLGAQADFDPTIDASLGHLHDTLPVAPGVRSTTDTTSLGLGATKTLGWGTRITPQASIQRLDARQRPSLGLPDDTVQRARVDLSVVQPLLRGAGSTGAESLVRAGRHGVRAAEHQVAFTAQVQAFDAAAAYWALVAAEQELALARASRERAQKLVDDTRLLVEADQRPRGDLRQLEGNLATRTRGVLDAENARRQRVHELRLAMGLELADAADWQPSDGFPEGKQPGLAGPQLADGALSRRQDVQAATASVEASEAAYAGADHNTLPQLDLSVSVGYAGASFDDGVGPFFQSTADNVEGLNGSAALTLSVPLDNSAQDGVRQAASAQLQSARLGEHDLRRTAQTRIVAALDDLELSAQSLASAMEAEKHYLQARDDERDKLRAGLSTVIDVVLTEDLLIQAQLARVRTELAYAIALTRLRFELGELPSNEAEVAESVPALLDAGIGHGG